MVVQNFTKVRYISVSYIFTIFRYPPTNDAVQQYKYIADAYKAGLHAPRSCSSNKLGTDLLLTKYLYTEYGTPVLTAKVTCCEYPAVANIPYIWRDTLDPIMRVLSTTLTGKPNFY